MKKQHSSQTNSSVNIPKYGTVPKISNLEVNALGITVKALGFDYKKCGCTPMDFDWVALD